MKKTIIAMIAVLGMASSVSFADGWGHGGGGGDQWRCQQASRDLQAAQNNFNQAQYLVNNNPQFCPGGWQTNAACMQTIANNYNQAVNQLQNAQANYNRACYGR